MAQILNYFGVGGLAFIFLSVFIEITPLKINPLGWFGQRINAGLAKDLKRIDDKLDEHIVQSYRNNILSFQNECLRGQMHSLEQYRVILLACTNYERYIRENDLQNGEIEEAMAYIKRKYQNDLDRANFVDIKNQQ